MHGDRVSQHSAEGACDRLIVRVDRPLVIVLVDQHQAAARDEHPPRLSQRRDWVSEMLVDTLGPIPPQCAVVEGQRLRGRDTEVAGRETAPRHHDHLFTEVDPDCLDALYRIPTSVTS